MDFDINASTLLGIDYGSARIGLAIKPAGESFALPLRVLTPRDEGEARAQVRAAIAEQKVNGVVVGLPLQHTSLEQNTEHTPNDSQAREVRRFCRAVRTTTRGVRWFFVDEHLTTQAADSISMEARINLAQDAPRGKRPTDDLAAKLILEIFLATAAKDAH